MDRRADRYYLPMQRAHKVITCCDGGPRSKSHRRACLNNGLTVIMTWSSNCFDNKSQNMEIVFTYPLGPWTVTSTTSDQQEGNRTYQESLWPENRNSYRIQL